jgi:hypothetical protein
MQTTDIYNCIYIHNALSQKIMFECIFHLAVGKGGFKGTKPSVKRK